MIEQLDINDVTIGSWILRNDLVSSAWLEDKINSEEKLASFKESYEKCNQPEKFKIVL